MDATLAAYGKIGILVNNAGVHLPKGVLDHEVDDWNFVMAVNTTGVWLGMKAVIPPVGQSLQRAHRDVARQNGSFTI